MILEMIRIILGLLFSIFLPGYLLSLILFRKLKIIERICLSVGLSVSILVFLGFFLSGIGYLINIKAINALSVWFLLLVVCVIFTTILLARKIGD